jgi:hypothetical protein
MEQLKGFVVNGHKRKVFKIIKSLYDLKQVLE